MSWTAGRVRALLILWRSCWSVPAISIALGMSPGAVITKIERLRRANHADALQGDLLRRLWAAGGRQFVSAERAAAALTMDGVRASLQRHLAG